MKTVEAAKGHWAMIFEHYGLPPITGKNHFKGKCPLCDSIGKFRIDNRDGAPVAAVTGLSWLPKPRANHSTRFAAKSMH